MAKKITFSLAPEIVADATDGLLLGDFNNWLHEAGIKLKKQKDGSLKATIDLEPGVYQYRYFLSDGRWVNDGNANGYSFNGEFGVDNCIISVPFEEVKETVAKGDLVTDIEVKTKKVPVKKEAVAPKAKVADAPKSVAKKAVIKKAAPAPKVTAPKVEVKKAAPKKAAAPAKKAAKKTK